MLNLNIRHLILINAVNYQICCDQIQESRNKTKASGYQFYFFGTKRHYHITGSNNWSAFAVGSMSLTCMPKIKFFCKCCYFNKYKNKRA